MANTFEQLSGDILQTLSGMRLHNTSATINGLMTEIALLKEEIEEQNARLSASTAILKETTKLIRAATAVTEAYKGQKMNAESVWASYWGVLKECDEAIFEMDSVSSREL